MLSFPGYFHGAVHFWQAHPQIVKVIWSWPKYGDFRLSSWGFGVNCGQGIFFWGASGFSILNNRQIVLEMPQKLMPPSHLIANGALRARHCQPRICGDRNCHRRSSRDQILPRLCRCCCGFENAALAIIGELKGSKALREPLNCALGKWVRAWQISSSQRV